MLWVTMMTVVEAHETVKFRVRRNEERDSE